MTDEQEEQLCAKHQLILAICRTVDEGMLKVGYVWNEQRGIYEKDREKKCQI